MYMNNQGILFSANNSIVENNEIERMVPTGGYDADYMRFWGDNNIVRGNYLHGSIQAEIGTSHTDCFQTFDNNGEIARNFVFERNICRDGHQGFLGGGNTLGSIDNLEFRNNIFTDLWSWGGVQNGEASNIKFYNNVFANLGIHGLGIQAGAPLEVRNNIFYNAATNYWAQSGTSVIGGNNLISQDHWMTHDDPTDLVDVDPLFVDPTNPIGQDNIPLTTDDGFNLQPASPAIDTAITLSSFSNDILSNTRPQGTAWDIGAYEFVSGSPPPPPPTLEGDLNGDSTVNSLDWSIMNASWNTSNTTADLNSDGIVNSIDFSIMNTQWTG